MLIRVPHFWGLGGGKIVMRFICKNKLLSDNVQEEHEKEWGVEIAMLDITIP